MSITAIMLGELKFNPNVFSGRLHKVIAPEMRDKEPNPCPACGISNAAIGMAHRAAVLRLMADGRRYTLSEICASVKMAKASASRHLMVLVQSGEACTNGTGRNGRWNPAEYWIAK